MAIGRKISKIPPLSLATRLHKDAANMPYFLLQAHLISNKLTSGWHRQRKRGDGESFWQFRPYVVGESIANIDWRRSAKSEQTYLRERELEIAQTVWIWPDQSASMHYCSRFSQVSKGNYSIILTLVLAKLLARNGEHIAIPNLMPPTMASNVIERVALALTNHQDENPFPDFSTITRFSHTIIMSDFLDHYDTIIQHLAILSAKQVIVHLIEIADPAEENFPYKGRTEFFDPETKEKCILGKAEDLRKRYCKLYQERRKKLINFCSQQGWSYHVSTTEQPLTKTILRLATEIRSTRSYARRAF
ncbi:DUF58 domain-containing protein [Bartonella sp. B41]